MGSWPGRWSQRCHKRTSRLRPSSSHPLAPATKCVDWPRPIQEGDLAIERPNRRLTTILAADAVGYSRLVGTDEEGTLERLRAIRKDLIDPVIAAHRGRIVKTTGDGLLAEFASAVDAARGAAELQLGMASQNINVPPDDRIDFRIGIHVGDIIIDENDIFGDGVNIAARLEGIAEPGRTGLACPPAFCGVSLRHPPCETYFGAFPPILNSIGQQF